MIGARISCGVAARAVSAVLLFCSAVLLFCKDAFNGCVCALLTLNEARDAASQNSFGSGGGVVSIGERSEMWPEKASLNLVR
jgi:hypothetical protein